MNVADMDDLAARLDAAGGQPVDDPVRADLIMVNTCTVRAKAEEKAYSFFGELKRLRRTDGTRPLLVGMGCVVNKQREELAKRFPHLDLWLDFSDPDGVLAALRQSFAPLTALDLDAEFTPALDTGLSPLRFVTAIRGCNHACAYCVVPRARGPQRDVPLDRIVAEAQRLERAGAPDLAVLGQNILAYGTTSGDKRRRFVELLETLLGETGFRWITYLTSLPGDLTEEICERIVAHPRVTPLLHLPLQSGSDRVLADMRRGYDLGHYRRLVAYARQCRPDLYLTTDLLVGFPTETEEDYQATLNAAEELGFDDAFMFAYSERPGTLAARKYGDPLPRGEKLRRLNELIARQRAWGKARNRRYVGQRLAVIVERIDGAAAVARTAFNKPVHLPAAGLKVGEYALTEITSAKVSSFAGNAVP
ncbi:MiaB/RimO family radical SAM methylthiotransferase [bacterium]|nr:MiaB/RimO family radical SAM methylthiotransferase [bacterium]